MASEANKAVNPPTNPFAAQQRLLQERLQFFLTTLHPMLRPDVAYALEAEGKLLSRPRIQINPSSSQPPPLPAGVWPLLTLLVAQSISPIVDPICASSVAIAMECTACAIDLLDDILDEDQTPTMQALGMARVTNVSTALLLVAQQAILSLSARDVAPSHILRLLDTLQEGIMAVTAGQHLDLLAEQRPVQDFTREECINIAAAKAGSLLRLACRLGAQCAGANDALCEQFSELGELVGIAAQLDNDCHDLYYLLQGRAFAVTTAEAETVSISGKTDLVRGKKTLPIVLAAAARSKARGASEESLDTPLQKRSEISDKENEEYLDSFHEGILTSWGICLLYRERARDRLQEIEAQCPVTPALRLVLGFE